MGLEAPTYSGSLAAFVATGGSAAAAPKVPLTYKKSYMQEVRYFGGLKVTACDPLEATQIAQQDFFRMSDSEKAALEDSAAYRIEDVVGHFVPPRGGRIMSATNIREEHPAYDALRANLVQNFALFSCFVNGEPAAAIVLVEPTARGVEVRPLFVSVTPAMVLTDHDGVVCAEGGAQ